MLTLAFESSAKAASVALCDGEKLLAMNTQNLGLTHSRTLLPMAEAMLKNADVPLKQVACFAVAHGPGSFTGIRIGVSTVKGLAWAAEKPCIGVSTLEALAWNGLAAGGLLCPVMDARRAQVYNALFSVCGGKPVRLCEDRPISLKELAIEIQERGEKPFLLGDGTELAAAYFAEQGIPFSAAPENIRWQNAWGVAMASLDKKPVFSQELLPVYLRLSQAERERQERLHLS